MIKRTTFSRTKRGVFADVLTSAHFMFVPCRSRGWNPIRPHYFNSVWRWAACANGPCAPDVCRGVGWKKKKQCFGLYWSVLRARCSFVFSSQPHTGVHMEEWTQCMPLLFYQDRVYLTESPGFTLPLFLNLFSPLMLLDSHFNNLLFLFLHLEACWIRLSRFTRQGVVITVVLNYVLSFSICSPAERVD